MLASALGLGLAAGLASGGRLSRLGELRIAWWPLLVGAVLVRLVASAAGDLTSLLYVGGFACVVVVAVANRSLPGAWLIAGGSALNLVVVAVNGAMPVASEAIASVGGTFPRDPLHVELSAASRLPFLADVIPFPIVRTAYSVGDVLLAIGGFWLPFVWLRRR